MRIHYIQHVPFETLGNVKKWAETRGHTITGTLMYEQDVFPPASDFDVLVVLGGPMGTYEEDNYSWLAKEKQFIKKAIGQNKKVLGICLGAQLIAEALGGKVYKNQHKEIGWLPVYLTEQAKQSQLFQNIPHTFLAFHWHGDTFDLPKDVLHIAYSEGCKHQAFSYKDQVLGLQFHIESTKDSIQQLIRHCSDDIDESKYVQTPDQMLSHDRAVETANYLIYRLLDNIESSV